MLQYEDIQTEISGISAQTQTHRVLAVGGTITVATLWTTRSRSAHPSKIDGRQICVAKRLVVIICSESMLPRSLLQWFKQESGDTWPCMAHDMAAQTIQPKKSKWTTWTTTKNIHVFQLLNHLAQDVDARNAPFCYFVDFRGQLGQLCHFGEAPLPRPERTLARMPYTDWRFSNPRCRCIHSSTWTNFSRILNQHLQWYLWYLGEVLTTWLKNEVLKWKNEVCGLGDMLGMVVFVGFGVAWKKRC